MSIETSAIGTLVIVLVMAAVTLATRWGGIFIMSFVPIGRRVQQFISAMSGSVLVALLAPLAADGDNGARLALLVTAATVLLLKKPLPAIAAGIAAAALFRQFSLLAVQDASTPWTLARDSHSGRRQGARRRRTGCGWTRRRVIAPPPVFL